VARTRNSVKTVKLQLSTTPQVVAALESLASTGKFGKNASEAGEELLRVKLREIELEGWLGANRSAIGSTVSTR
jgi:hypothetical protein